MSSTVLVVRTVVAPFAVVKLSYCLSLTVSFSLSLKCYLSLSFCPGFISLFREIKNKQHKIGYIKWKKALAMLIIQVYDLKLSVFYFFHYLFDISVFSLYPCHIGIARERRIFRHLYETVKPYWWWEQYVYVTSNT